MYKRQVHIRHLREKLNDTSDTPQYIKTIWGVGYKKTCIRDRRVIEIIRLLFIIVNGFTFFETILFLSFSKSVLIALTNV